MTASEILKQQEESKRRTDEEVGRLFDAAMAAAWEPLEQVAVATMMDYIAEHAPKINVSEYGRVIKFDEWGMPETYKFTPEDDTHEEDTEMYMMDPLNAPLGPKYANWTEKLNAIQWVRHNFTPGMLAELYKLSYVADGLRIAACDAIISKESKA